MGPTCADLGQLGGQLRRPWGQFRPTWDPLGVNPPLPSSLAYVLNGWSLTAMTYESIYNNHKYLFRVDRFCTPNFRVYKFDSCCSRTNIRSAHLYKSWPRLSSCVRRVSNTDFKGRDFLIILNTRLNCLLEIGKKYSKNFDTF